MKIDIWYDFVCPFCYMGERKFEQALARFEHTEDVDIHFRSFQLNMGAGSYDGGDIHQMIADKYNMSYEQAKSNNDRIVKAASEVGLDFRFDILKPANTSVMHQIAYYAKSKGKQKDLVDRYFKAYFEEGAPIANLEVLLGLAAEIGLDPTDLSLHLQSETFLSQVLEDQNAAKELGITGVPFFILNGKVAVSGAQDSDHFLKALMKASEAL